jgi:tetratricopeptide (TPR) repeat protein
MIPSFRLGWRNHGREATMVKHRSFLGFPAAAGVLLALVLAGAAGAEDGTGGAGRLLDRVRALFADGRFAEVIDTCTELLRGDSHLATAYRLRGQARLLSSSEATDAALADFTAAIDSADRFAEAYFDRGILYLNRGSKDLALRDLDQAIRAGLASRDAWFYRGMAYLQAERFAEAVDDFTAALRIDPELAAAYLNRGVARYRLDHLKDAQSDLDKAIILNARLARAYLNRGVVRLKRGDVDGAVVDFDEAISEARRSGDRASLGPAYFDRGKAFYTKRDYARAIDDWQHLVRQFDEADAMTLDFLGLAHAQLQDEVKAGRCFEDAIRLDRTRSYAPAHAHLAAVRFNQRNYAAALKECTAALEIDPALADAYATRSLAFRALNQPDRARADQERSAQLRAVRPIGAQVAETRRR